MSNTESTQSEDSSFIARMRAQQAEEAAARSQRNMKDRFVRWEKGQEWNVRILPPDDATQLPYVMGAVHYGLAIPRQCSGRTTCSLCKVLQHWRNQGYDKHENKIKELSPKLKGFYKVIVRELVKPGQARNAIKFMSHSSLSGGKNAGKGVHDKIVALFLKPGAESKGHPASVYNGYDLRIELPKASPGYDFEASRDNTALMPTTAEIDEYLAVSKAEFNLQDCVRISAEDAAETEEIAKKLLSGELKVTAFGGKDISDLGDYEQPAVAASDALKEPPFCIGNPEKREEFRADVCPQCNFAGDCDHRIAALKSAGAAAKPAPASSPSTVGSVAATAKSSGPSLEEFEKQHKNNKGHGKGSK